MVIQKTLAVLLLAVFALSITPKLTLHQLVADHTDLVTAIDNTDSEKVSTAGFKCDCDQLVAESPFADNVIVFHFKKLSAYPAFINPAYKIALLSGSGSTDTRGPPSI